MHVQVGASVLGLVITGCDIALTRRGEVQYMWSVDTVLASMWLVDGAEQVPEEHCRNILLFRTIAFSAMLVLLELVLMLRVYALYDRSRAIGTFLLSLLVTRIASSGYTAHDHVLRFPEKIKFTSHCIPGLDFKNARNPVWVIIYGELIVQSAIIILAMKRTVWDFRQYSHSLFPVLNRDGLRVFGAIVVAMAAIVATSVKQGTTSFFTFPLFMALVSVTGCHTILNLQKLEWALDANSSEQQKDMELTNINSVNVIEWEAPWDTTTFQMIEDATITRPEQDAGSSSSGMPCPRIIR
ncbi:hypothetical protein BDP27DRAFT_1406226 [Rhodocollybia butyracea]|uniref:Uncharacterized protein n=1 Tax=Rhodocollybia butyracea TaxID=206335 RepID=A0A9P5PBC5_9AGAR|nr:hypothetical protein BDP27DRAFT_1406226 [Rhodocollybia butyracea]